MVSWPESRLLFDFDDSSWTDVKQWDKEAAYTEGLARFQATKAVDFIGLHGSDPYFIEVKNFCDYRVGNKRRLTSGELAADVADKVRDTIAGWCGA